MFSQNTLHIKGKVTTENKIVLGQANVILKNNADSIIAFTTTNIDGIFYVKAVSKAKQFILEVRCLGFEKQLIVLNSDNENNKIEIILKPSTLQLSPVNVISKSAPIKIDHDTTTYKLNRFLSGNEEVVEDALKKLPGIEVNDDGKITYKGKEITTVLVEGDDLFSNDYQIGTKNIKSAVIDEIQAIEHYTSNGKLAGLTDSKETVLNLKVKKDVKTRPVLSGSFGYGIKNSYDTDANLIGVGKTAKYFIQGSVNDIGLNPTPYEYYTFKNCTPEIDDIALDPQKLINNYYSLPALKPQRGYINNTKFTSGNAIFKPSKSVTITANYSLYADKLNFGESSNTQYYGLPDNLNIIENQKIDKSPVLGSAFTKVFINLSSNTSITFNTDYNSEQSQNNSVINANYGMSLSSLLDRNYLLAEKVNYTYRLSRNSALLLDLKVFTTNQHQNYSLVPGLSIIDSGLSQNTQLVQVRNKGGEVSSSYLLKQGNISQSINIKLAENVSNATTQLNYSPVDYQNAVNSTNGNLQLNYINTLTLNKLKLSGSSNYNITKTTDENEVSDKLNKQINYFSPAFRVEYSLSELDKIASSTSCNSSLPLATDLLQNYLLTDNHTLTKGLYVINKQNTLSFVSTFIHANLFNQFIYYLNFIIVRNSRAYGYSDTFNFDYFINDRIITPDTKNYIITASFSKYLSFLSSTLKYTGNFSWYTFYEQINPAPLTQSLAINNGEKLELKSGFNKWFNFEVGGKYLFNEFKTSSLGYANNNQNIESYFNFLIKPSDYIFVSLINEQYFENINASHPGRYYFIDLNIRLQKKRISYKIIGNNLLNNKVYVTKIIGVNSVTYQTNNLLPMKILGEIEYRF